MSSDDLKLEFRIVGNDEASASLRSVIETMRAMERQAEKTGKALRANLSGGLMGSGTPGTAGSSEHRMRLQRTAVARARATTDAIRDAGKVWKIRERSEKAEVAGIAAGHKAWADAQRRRLGIMDRSAAVEMRRIREVSRAEASAIRETASARARAERDTYRQIRQRWNIRDRSEREERREAERAMKTEAAASNHRMSNIARTWRIRQASEAAEMRHLKAVGREHASRRREAMRAGREAFRQGQHALRSVNHPAFESIGHATALGAAFGAGAAKTILERSVDIDSAAARYRMFAVPEGADATKATAEAVRAAKLDSIKLGMDAATLLDMQAKAVRNGISPAIAKTLPEAITAAVKIMGGDPERLTDTLSEGIQQGISMGLMKDAGDVRRFLNLEAGLSNFAGNSSAKMEEFVSAGGIGRGKELGLNLTDTMAYGALLNSSGMRTGQATSRFLGQLSQSVPKMYDRYRRATESRKNTEEDRAIRSAPAALGYGSIRAMQSRILAGPEGLIEFSTRLNKLNEKQRKLILEGYGFSEQGGAALAEIGASPEKARGVLMRAKELAAQREANDYLSEKFRDWQTSLANMLQQIEAGWRAIESELGDVLKNDIVAPMRDWWGGVSARIISSDMKEDAHRAITAFVNGLGFADMKALLDRLSSNVRGFDPAGFMRGLGEGLRTVIDDLRSFGSVLEWIHGSGDGEALGKFAAEMFGLSVALHVVAPVVTIIGGIAATFLALKAAIEVGAWVSELTGLTTSLKTFMALDFASGAAGLASLTGGLMAIIGLAKIASDKGIMQAPKSWDSRGFLNFLDPNLGDMVLGKEGQKPGDGMMGRDFVKGAHGGLVPRRQSYDGDSFSSLRQDISWSPSDSGDVTRDAMLGTERGVDEVREAVDRLGAKLTLASLGGIGGGAGYGGGGGAGGGNANLRYGRTVSGGHASTPGTGSYGNPSKSLLDLIAQSEGSGYNVSWGNGRFLPGGKEQNLTGKSLNEILALGDTMRRQPGARNSSALGRYQITGSTLRDLMKRMGLNGSEKFDEAMQDRLASKLIADEGPRALNRWEGLKRGDYMARAKGLLRSNSIASQPGDTSSNGAGGGSAGKAVDIAMGMQGAGERSAQQILGAHMHPGEWCADFVNGTLKRASITGSGSAMARSFSGWGHHVGLDDVRKGDVIEENAHGHGVNHVGLATGNVKRDKAGNVTAVEMVSGNYGNIVKRNWERVGIIADLRRSDQAIAETARKVGASIAAPAAKPVTPADITGRIRSNTRPLDDVPAGNMTSAENSTTIHAPIHIHGITDPHAVARTVMAHIDSRNSRYTDDGSVG